MKRTTIALLALLIAAPAVACMGMLVHTELLIGGVACTYRLSDNSLYRVVYQGASYCPPCLQ